MRSEGGALVTVLICPSSRACSSAGHIARLSTTRRVHVKANPCQDINPLEITKVGLIHPNLRPCEFITGPQIFLLTAKFRRRGDQIEVGRRRSPKTTTLIARGARRS